MESDLHPALWAGAGLPWPVHGQIPENLALDDWATTLTGQPARNTAAVVAASSVLFYIAERGHNPKVTDIWDAFVYCSTCLSVGYGDIFAKTPVGKILGSALMTVGPALSGATLDGKQDPSEERLQNEILATLREILEKLLANSPAVVKEPI